MAFKPDSAIQDWRHLVEVQLDSGSVYFSKDAVVIGSTLYQGRLESITPLHLSAGGLLDPRIVTPGLSFSLDNANNAISALLDADTWVNRLVIIKVGQGKAAADYDEVYRGKIQFGGISFDDQFVNINLVDARQGDSKVLPTGKFFASTYANLEAKSANMPIPLVYGDWSSGAEGAQQVPAYCIDTTAGTGGKFKIASHALKEIGNVYLNGSDITGNCTLDAANGEFTISSTSTYDELVDVVTVHCKGATDDGTTSGTLLVGLVDILDDLLQTHLGVDAADIDSAAMAAWAAELSASDEGRRVISTELNSDTIITSLLVEGFADLTIQDGKYYPLYRVVNTSGLTTYRDFDIKARGDGRKDFAVILDEERVFINQVVAQYQYDPAGAKYGKRYDKDNSASQASVGATKRRRLQMDWLYKANGAQDRAERELWAYSSEVENLQVSIGPKALALVPTDQFRLDYGKFAESGGLSAAPFQIREITADFDRMEAIIRCWNITQLSAGVWTADSAPTWLLSNATQRSENGFWTDASGFADPSGSPDPASASSRWF